MVMLMLLFEKGEKDIEEATLLKLERAIYNSNGSRGQYRDG